MTGTGSARVRTKIDRQGLCERCTSPVQVGHPNVRLRRSFRQSGLRCLARIRLQTHRPVMVNRNSTSFHLKKIPISLHIEYTKSHFKLISGHFLSRYPVHHSDTKKKWSKIQHTITGSANKKKGQRKQTYLSSSTRH